MRLHWPFRWPWQPHTDLDGARKAKEAAHRDRPKVEAVADRAERLYLLIVLIRTPRDPEQ